jgi:hypothetical protein
MGLFRPVAEQLLPAVIMDPTGRVNWHDVVYAVTAVGSDDSTDMSVGSNNKTDYLCEQ